MKDERDDNRFLACSALIVTFGVIAFDIGILFLFSWPLAIVVFGLQTVAVGAFFFVACARDMNGDTE